MVFHRAPKLERKKIYSNHTLTPVQSISFRECRCKSSHQVLTGVVVDVVGLDVEWIRWFSAVFLTDGHVGRCSKIMGYLMN